jgi:hypothetical protein
MDSLNPEWLSIEVQSIDLAMEGWSEAMKASYDAALLSLLSLSEERDDAARDKAIEMLVASLRPSNA